MMPFDTSDIAISRTRSEPVSARTALFALFDSVRDPVVGYTHTTVYGAEARDALIVWAATNSLLVELDNHEHHTTWRVVVRHDGTMVECEVEK